MASNNSLSLIGTVISDPRFIEFDGERKLAEFAFSVRRKYKNKKGERETDVFSVESRQIKFVEQFVKKRGQYGLQGELRVKKFTTKDGREAKKVYIAAEDMYIVKLPEDGDTDTPKKDYPSAPTPEANASEAEGFMSMSELDEDIEEIEL